MAAVETNSRIKSIAHRVDTVFRNPRKVEQLGDVISIDRKAGSGQGAGAERQHIDAIETARKPLPVTLEHLVVCKQMMGKPYRLSALQVRIAGHDDLQILPGSAR